MDTDDDIFEVHGEFGKIDILVNNAGIAQGGGHPVEDCPFICARYSTGAGLWVW